MSIKWLLKWRLRRTLFLLCLAFAPRALGLIGTDGLCTLYTFVPFTNNGTSTRSFQELSSTNINLGVSHMAAALMAMDHFNNRNTTVVPELANLVECDIVYDMNQSLVFDTGSTTHMASRTLAAQSQQPSAIAGPFNDLPALELSTLAQSFLYPLVAYGASNLRVIADEFSPFSLQTYPDIDELAGRVYDFLLDKERTNYFGITYSLSDTGVQRSEVLAFRFNQAGLQTVSSSYLVEADMVKRALRTIHESGYRTIIVAMEDPLGELPLIADAAEDLGINNGDYMWLWFDKFEPFALISNNTNIQKIVNGSAWILPASGSELNPDSDPFTIAWSSQGTDFVRRVNEASPIEPGEPGYIFVNDTFFQDYDPESGSSFIYDAVMSIGLGACAADKQDGIVYGDEHYRAIQSLEFTGATGPVRFGEGEWSGTRAAASATWGALNLNPSPLTGEERVAYKVSDRYDAGTNRWQEVSPFVYRDGRTVPPDLLRTVPEQNYLSPGLRAMGFTLVGIAFLFAMVSAAWVYINRKHQVLRAAQPHFLYLLALGAAIETSSILPVSFDESYGWSESQLSSGCMAMIWLLVLGHIITYCALFTKLWRVNKVLQFSRRRVKVRHVAWPMAVLMVVALVILSLWNALDPVRWNRVVINDITDESIGQCSSDMAEAFAIPLVGVMIIPTLLAAVFAWKTKDVDGAYAESWWIFALIVVQIEVVLVAVPVVIILLDVSSDGRYAGFTLMQWTFPISTLSFVMLPKFLAYRKAKRGGDRRQARKRGQQPTNGVYVSGVSGTSSLPASTNTDKKLDMSHMSQIEEENEGD